MSAGNAFAAARNGTSRDGDHQEKLHESSRPAKRQRTSEIAHSTTLWLPSAQQETALEVDIMILDHIAFQATKACLGCGKDEDGSNAASGTLRCKFQLVESFTSMFKLRHPQYQPDAELRLRLLVLRTATLCTQRFTLNPATPDRSSLQNLREVNRKRAQAWIGESRERVPSRVWDYSPFVDTEPLTLSKLEINRAHVLHQLGVPAEDQDYEDAFYGTSSCISLLDLLPLFMELSAASSSLHGSTLTTRWMQLACEFMLQACLEQYLVCGAKGLEVLDEAFAWGYVQGEDAKQDGVAGRHPFEINDMFEDDTYATEVEGWSVLKHESVRKMMASWDSDESSANAKAGIDVASHLETVATKHPIDAFQASTLKFLEALSISIAEPVLVQLGKGKLDGMSEAETTDFLAECGVDHAQI